MKEIREAFRTAWITGADFQRVRDLGFNHVRVPFNYTVLTENLTAAQLDQLAQGDLSPALLNWKWLDSAVTWAEQAGLYVILDMHGLPGGQSTADHTGWAGQNRYFNPSDPNYHFYHALARELWKAIAGHYRDRYSIAAFDLINEPMGAVGIGPINLAHDELTGAVWQADPDRVVILEDGFKGLSGMRRSPHPQGRQVELTVFSRHIYPWFGRPSDSVDASWLFGTYVPQEFGANEAAQQSLNAPLYVGEWNIIVSQLGGGDSINRFLSQMDGREWSSALWIYKQADRNPVSQWWSIYRNQTALDLPNFASDSKEVILTKLQNVRTENLSRYGPMKDALALPDGWTSADVGAIRWAGSATYNRLDRAWTVFGGGAAIGGSADQFQFASRGATGAGALTAQIVSLSSADPAARAGVMFRASTSVAAPFVAVVAAPTSGVTLQWRTTLGGPTQTIQVEGSGPVPVWVRLVRRQDTFSSYNSSDGETWTHLGVDVTVTMPATVRAGLVVTAGANGTLAQARFANVLSTVNEQFIGRSINLRAVVNGRYVSADNAGAFPLVANRTSASFWELFDVVDGGNGHLAIRARVNNKYVTADIAGQSPLIASADIVGLTEQFDVDDVGGGRYALRAVGNGKYVSAENAGQLPLIANRDVASLWEWFEIVIR